MIPTPLTDEIAHLGLGESAYISRMTEHARALEREYTQMLSVLKQIAMADHPAITSMDDAVELGRRLTTAARLARVYLSES